jgi:hypothetical protein
LEQTGPDDRGRDHGDDHAVSDPQDEHPDDLRNRLTPSGSRKKRSTATADRACARRTCSVGALLCDGLVVFPGRELSDKTGAAERAVVDPDQAVVMCGGAWFRGHGIPDAEHIDGIDACPRQQERVAEASSTRASFRDD